MVMKASSLIGLFVFLYIPSVTAQEIWVGKDGNIRNVDTRAMAADKAGFYLATRNEVYKAKDGERWGSIFMLPSGENEIRCFALNAKSMLVGTRRGLFRSTDHGRTWRDVFRTLIPEKNNIICIEVSGYGQNNIVIGTEKGIYLSEDGAAHWNDISGNLKNRNVRCIGTNKNTIFAGSDYGLYVKNDGRDSWERVYVHSQVTNDVPEEGGADISEETEGYDAAVSCIAMKDARLYIGIGNKMIYSDDNGQTWKSVPVDNIHGDITYILPSRISNSIYCATTKGVFRSGYSDERGDEPKDGSNHWRELYAGFDKAISVNKLVFDADNEKSIWALTEKGVYKLETGRYAESSGPDVKKYLKTVNIIYSGEPTYKELQRAAMRFSEVSPDKISNWRYQARIKSLLPKVSLGWSKSSSNTSEIYTNATKDYIVTGPDDISNGANVSLSWDVGGLIWSDDQTNIDVRSRLTTQLRNDILDDLRRAYFERKRVQFELAQSSAQDLKGRFEKELRVRELTQAIDDMTGNYLSDNMERNKSEALPAGID